MSSVTALCEACGFYWHLGGLSHCPKCKSTEVTVECDEENDDVETQEI